MNDNGALESSETQSGPAKPLIFLDMDDVLVLNETYNGWAALNALSLGVEACPELWQQLVFPEGRDNLRALHEEFGLTYVISSTWATQFTQSEMQEVLRRTGLTFVADNMHADWSTPRKRSSERLQEIEWWLERNPQPGRPFLVLDDESSGESLRTSDLKDAGHVVLCEEWKGLVQDKFEEARRLIRAQVAIKSRKKVFSRRPLF